MVTYEPDCAPEAEGEAVAGAVGVGDADFVCAGPAVADATIANKKKKSEREVVFMCGTGLKIIQTGRPRVCVSLP